MSNKIFNAIIQLRRDNDYNFAPINNTFVPANGEVVLIDTATEGLRAKVGDGSTVLGALEFIDSHYRNAAIQGYYDTISGNFYIDNSKTTLLVPQNDKIYIDSEAGKIYYYDGSHYVNIESNFSTATASQPGILKLYNTTGQNVDGTMTQKAITDELEQRFKASIDNELLILSV